MHFKRMRTVPDQLPVLKVLVVEDEPILRMDAVDLIEDAGFIAHEASCAQDAIELLKRNPDIAVLFTDVEMPGTMNGIELAAWVHERFPPVDIIVASGHPRINASSLPCEGRFFAKPYQPGHVADLLHAIAARNGERRRTEAACFSN